MSEDYERATSIGFLKETMTGTTLEAIHRKVDRGDLLTTEERAVLSANLCVDIQKRIRGVMSTERAKHDNPVRYSQGDHNAVAQAVDLLIVEMLTISAAHSEKREQVRAEVKGYVDGEVRLLLKFCENQARTINGLNQKVSAIEKALGLAKSKPTARRA